MIAWLALALSLLAAGAALLAFAASGRLARLSDETKSEIDALKVERALVLATMRRIDQDYLTIMARHDNERRGGRVTYEPKGGQ